MTIQSCRQTYAQWKAAADDLAHCRRHNYAGHNYIGHNYIGHAYIGHNYIGHNYNRPQLTTVLIVAAIVAVVLGVLVSAVHI